uniref:Uncharacterized protein n=1 Tax=Meloidogyne incognita TaxID=6306 RepID=A0A914MYT5_MELIC
MDQFLGLIDNLFISAPKILPLDSFCVFLSETCNANENNLLYSSTTQTETTALFLQKICQVTCNNNQTFLQKLCIWLTIKKHFVLCSTNSSTKTIPTEINRRAIDVIQEILNNLLFPSELENSLNGWNSFLFSIFTFILQEEKEEKNCTLETCIQIGNIFLNFVEQNNFDLIGTGWTELFASLKLLTHRQHNTDISLSPISTIISLKEEDISIPTPPLPALTSIVIEICNKFLFNHTKRPTLFLLMFNEFCDLLLFALEVNGSFAWKVEQQKQIKEKEKQQYILLLENSEKILFEYLLNSSIITSTFPRGFIFQIKNKLKEKEEMFNQFLLNKNDNKENYLNLLPDLSEEINLIEVKDDCSCKLILKNWLDKGKLLEKINDRTIEFGKLKFIKKLRKIFILKICKKELPP